MKENKAIKKIPALLLLLSVAAAIFRGVVLFKYTDFQNGLYTNQTVGNVFFAVVVVLVAATAVLYFPLKKCEKEEKQKQGPVFKVMSAVCAAMMTAVLINDVVLLVSGGFSLLLAAEAVLCIPSVIYFVSNVTEKCKEYRSVLALFPALYTAIHTIIRFIDTTTQINASQRSFTLLMLVFIMMHFVNEAELFIPRDKEAESSAEASGKRYAKYVVVGLIAAELAIIVAAPGIVFSAVAVKEMGAVIYGIAHFALGLYALSK